MIHCGDRDLLRRGWRSAQHWPLANFGGREASADARRSPMDPQRRALAKKSFSIVS